MPSTKSSTSSRPSAKGKEEKSSADKASNTSASRAATHSGTRPEKQLDAIALLKADHAEVKAMYEEFEKLAEQDGDPEERALLAAQICDALEVHATIEEEIFYPAAREADVDSDLLDEAEVEHASAKDLIAQIRDMAPEDDLFVAKVTVLCEYVEHHVEEEENELFPACKKAKMDLVALGEQLAERKAALMTE